MLKIKDSVDLKELEKFGFRKHRQDSDVNIYWNFLKEIKGETE